MEPIARKNFDLLMIEYEERGGWCCCIVTRDGWFNRRITGNTRAECIEKFLAGRG